MCLSILFFIIKQNQLLQVNRIQPLQTMSGKRLISSITWSSGVYSSQPIVREYIEYRLFDHCAKSGLDARGAHDAHIRCVFFTLPARRSVLRMIQRWGKERRLLQERTLPSYIQSAGYESQRYYDDKPIHKAGDKESPLLSCRQFAGSQRQGSCMGQSSQDRPEEVVNT